MQQPINVTIEFISHLCVNIWFTPINRTSKLSELQIFIYLLYECFSEQIFFSCKINKIEIFNKFIKKNNAILEISLLKIQFEYYSIL